MGDARHWMDVRMESPEPGKGKKAAADAAPVTLVVNGMTSAVNAFLAECATDGCPMPPRADIEDRIRHVLASVDPHRPPSQSNSLARNRRLFLVRTGRPPYFGVGTAE